MMIQKNILWVDCCAAVSAGLIVLLAAQWLSQMYHLSKNIIIFIDCTNLLYACYSFILANYRRRSATLINILVIANGFWCIICLIIIWWFWHEMTILAIMHIGGEAIFVATLAKFEYLWRNRLIVSDFIS